MYAFSASKKFLEIILKIVEFTSEDPNRKLEFGQLGPEVVPDGKQKKKR